jgi:hypothetical protein
VLLAALLGVAACGTPSTRAPGQDPWTQFDSFRVRHAVDFPGVPTEIVRESKVGAGRIFTTLNGVEAGNRYYGTAWTQLPWVPADKAGRERMLDTSANAALQATGGGKLVSRRPVTVSGIEGVVFVVDLPQGGQRLMQRIFIAGDGLVEQTYTGPAGSETERDAGRFFGSLKLLP